MDNTQTKETRIEDTQHDKLITKAIKDYDSLTSTESKQKYIEGLVYTSYVPYMTKKVVASSIVQQCMFVSDTHIPYIDYNELNLMKWLAYISMYTRLKTSHESYTVYDAYDALRQSEMLRRIMQTIPREEIDEFSVMCDNEIENATQINQSAQAYISQQVNQFAEVVNVGLDNISQKLITMMDNDPEKLADKIKNVIKFIKK